MESKDLKIKVIGSGGAGNNIVNSMNENKLDGVELYVANTDRQVLEKAEVQNRICRGEYMMLTLVKPAFDDLWFREKLMADEETMSYNARWGGTIPFPEDAWESWYESWVRNPGADRYYRYLLNPENEYVGEIAYHYDKLRDIYICDVIVLAQYRDRGYGTDAVQQLCTEAKNNGILVLYDDIAADNPSYKLFLKNGFDIEYKNEDVVMVKRNL